ncbi:MAG: hypothetical protein JNL69_09240 [Bacteroidia bacterium]|jgi:uncharacterized membrane protein|nr:hypothetical protein [Bacteroidia bacterium]
MKKETLFYVAVIFTVIGLSLIGLGVGKIFNRPCVGTIIGLGIGLCATALILFRIFRRIDAFEKK